MPFFVIALVCLLLFYAIGTVFQLYHGLFVCLLFYVLATPKVISGWAPTCDSSHSWRLNSAASLGQQAAGTMTCYPTQSHYPHTEPTSPCPILIMPSIRLGSNKYQFLSHWFDSTKVRKCEVWIRTRDLPEREADTLPIRPPRLVVITCVR